MHRKQLTDYCNELLAIDQFKDYCPNGLQIEGKQNIKKIVSGVTACQALIDQAIQAEADLLLVHHGYFWRNESACIVGMKKKRIASLINNDINLLAYHIPLDAHAVYGNNVQLAQRLKINISQQRFDSGYEPSIGFMGEFAQAVTADELTLQLKQVLRRKPLHINGGNKKIKTVAWCTGGAQNYFAAAAQMPIDAYITGEISENNTHAARELGIHFFAAGHHASERYGVQALGQHLQDKFEIDHEFIEIDNPV